MKQIYVVRHCQAEGQAANAQLTELGRQQASELTEFFLARNIDCIVSSPYDRAYQSIEGVAARRGIEVVIDDRLTERLLSSANNPEWREMLKHTYDDFNLCYEGGESSRAATERVIAVMEELMQSHYDHIIVVTHGNLLSLLLKYYDNRIGYAQWANLSNPDVFLLSFDKNTPKIERIWSGLNPIEKNLPK